MSFSIEDHKAFYTFYKHTKLTSLEHTFTGKDCQRDNTHRLFSTTMKSLMKYDVSFAHVDFRHYIHMGKQCSQVCNDPNDTVFWRMFWLVVSSKHHLHLSFLMWVSYIHVLLLFIHIDPYSVEASLCDMSRLWKSMFQLPASQHAWEDWYCFHQECLGWHQSEANYERHYYQNMYSWLLQ